MKPMWNTGFASSMCPKYPGESWLLAPSVVHLMARSMVPSLGSESPLSLGFPCSYVWGASILATE